ncbi:MAG: NAD(P)/FAD-dependent oxidoreductase [Steroidobacteraceae bacterium]
MSDRAECVVIGAGVVGLAVARSLAEAGHEVLVLEAEAAIGTGISARSSEVIHAGLYYPQGSLKARGCVQGRELLYVYCAEHGVDHRRCGKLIVATDPAQRAQLDRIEACARANGVADLRRLEAAEATTMEPALRCTAALYSPSTGIVDTHGLMLSLQGDIERAGGFVVCRTPVQGGQYRAGALHLQIGPEGQCRTLIASHVINCAGLGAQDVARGLGVAADRIPPRYYAKGSYFSFSGLHPFSHLIYPVPEPGGLGLHLTLDLAGRARFGPDVEWVEHADFAVDARRADRFAECIRRYWPGLPEGALQPAYAGIRPKVVGPGATSADFCVQGAQAHGIPGLVNLYGIESPGLTAALAIGRIVCERMYSP